MQHVQVLMQLYFNNSSQKCIVVTGSASGKKMEFLKSALVLALSSANLKVDVFIVPGTTGYKRRPITLSTGAIVEFAKVVAGSRRLDGDGSTGAGAGSGASSASAEKHTSVGGAGGGSAALAGKKKVRSKFDDGGGRHSQREQRDSSAF